MESNVIEPRSLATNSPTQTVLNQYQIFSLQIILLHIS